MERNSYSTYDGYGNYILLPPSKKIPEKENYILYKKDILCEGKIEKYKAQSTNFYNIFKFVII